MKEKKRAGLGETLQKYRYGYTDQGKLNQRRQDEVLTMGSKALLFIVGLLVLDLLLVPCVDGWWFLRRRTSRSGGSGRTGRIIDRVLEAGNIAGSLLGDPKSQHDESNDSPLQRLDVNQDGALSRQELLQLDHKDQVLTDSVFRFLDHNGDGLLQRDELKQVADEAEDYLMDM